MRTNIEIDDELLQQAMRNTGACSKEAVVEAGLRLLLETHNQTGIRQLRGKVQWRGNLKSLRRSRFRD
jgi:Arc/MetJ family transcription regulator